MELSLRPLGPGDFSMVSGWLRSPHVDQWWHEAYSPAEVAEKYQPCLDGREPTSLLVVVCDGADVGFVQWYRWDDYPDERDGYGGAANEIGLDYLIGEVSACGRGVGTAMIAAVAGYLRSQCPTAASMLVAPSVDNAASCRVLEVNGFVRVGETEVAPKPGERAEGPVALYRRTL